MAAEGPEHLLVCWSLVYLKGLDLSVWVVYQCVQGQEVIFGRSRHLTDVACVTALWLVAREEIGGLGKKKRV